MFLFVCAALCGFFQKAFAAAGAGLTFIEGLKAYQAGDFERARQVFERLAELGHASAQFNLGAMYYRGEGVEKGLVKAYGWFCLASEGGDEEAKKLSDLIYEKLSPVDQIEAIKLRDSLIRGHGKAALNMSLIPELMQFDLGYCQLKKVVAPLPQYPPIQARHTREGWVDVEFTIDKSGYVRDLFVVESVPGGSFSHAAINAMRKHKYAPPLVNGRNSEVYGHASRVIFKIDMESPLEYEKRLDNFFSSLLEKAKTGDPFYQFLYGYAMSSHPRVERINRAETNEWYLKAAQGGYSPAQHALAYSLLYGQGCAPDNSKAIEWLTLAAKADYARSQLLLGRILLQMQQTPDQAQKALFWIGKAAEQDFPPALMTLAWLQATNGDEKLRNPGNALKLAKLVYEDYPDQVRAFETMAAAHAALGDFKKAVKFQKKAIAEAEDLEWSLEQPQLRMDAYSAGKAWYES